ncbi:MAG: ribosome biogenesis GTPase Der [bacterium]|nr:ribosome biogenesis GTPase Der [bacterium]
MQSLTPAVAIIGRPNVGKSTLFNRLVGRRQAIVHDLPGVTRDRIAGSAQIDDDRSVELVDTGGLVPDDDPLGLSEQVFLAIEASDLLLLLVDGKEGLVAADEKVVAAVRRHGKPTVLVVNKGDTNAAQDQFADFYRLGLEHQLLISAEHGTGINDLRDLIAELVPLEEAPTEQDGAPALAIVGRPNVGKSSVLNRLLGESRVLVSPVAGTTRDPIDTVLEWDDRTWRLIDTAGIRRRSQVEGVAEGVAVMFARRQMERADVVVLVVDAAAGVTTGDLSIAGLAWEMGRGVVVALNKWDLLDPESRQDLEDSWPRLEELLSSPPRINVSALTGRRVDRLLPAVAALHERLQTQLATAEVNRIFERSVRDHQAPQKGGRPWKLYYATQVATAPPTFMLFANRTLDRRDTYRRYLENRLRAELDLAGVPVRLVIRKRG